MRIKGKDAAQSTQPQVWVTSVRGGSLRKHVNTVQEGSSQRWLLARWGLRPGPERGYS